MPDATLILAKLDGKELEKSINDLVDKVANKSQEMAQKFEGAMDIMKSAMKDFAITQKVSVDLMRQAWRDMSASFDAMLTAQSSAQNARPQYAQNTVGGLQEIIAAEEKRRKNMELGSAELKKQNNLIEQQKNLLKQEKESSQAYFLRRALDMQANDLATAEAKLKKLYWVQSKFGNATWLSAQQQSRLTKAIAQTESQIQRLKAKAPKTLKEVLGMDESSVDAIARKMRALKMVQVDPKNAREVSQLGAEYQKLSKLQSDMLGKNALAEKSNNALARSFSYIRNRIVYALTLGAITNFTRQIYEVRGQYELLERSLGVLTDSMRRGSEIFRELSTMALKSPFTLIELGTAAKQLTAYDFSAREVVDTTRRLADISAALGVPMERLTYNLGQIRAQTVLTARDARDFANAGLPIVKSLADYYSELEGRIVSTGEVYQRMSKKMVSYNDVMAVIMKVTDEGGKFFDFQAKQADTLRVQMANLTLAYNNMLNDIGSSNQALLSAPLKALKTLMQNWRTFNRLLIDTRNILTIFGIFSAIYAKIATTLGVVNLHMKTFYITGMKINGILGQMWKWLSTTLMNPALWAALVAFAAFDLYSSWQQNVQAVREFNQELRKLADESAASIDKFLDDSVVKNYRKMNETGTMSAADSEKTWEMIREQIDTSASSSDKLLADLMAIPDINQRISEGFNVIEKIRNAQAALSELKDESIEFSKSLMGGVFGEGLADDLKDYADAVQRYNVLFNEGFSQANADKESRLSQELKEFREELDITALSVQNFLKQYKITDPKEIVEVLESVKLQIKAKNPEIQGELASLFDIEFDKRMSTLTNNVVDANTSLWKMFLDRLRMQSGSVFRNITDDIYKESSKLTKEQQKAVDDALAYFKGTMPFYYQAIENMVRDANQLKINIGVTFGVTQMTDFQNEVQKRIKAASKTLDFGSAALLPTQNDDLKTWTEARQKSIKDLKEENANYEKDGTQWAKGKIKANNTLIAQQENLLHLFNQSYEAEKKSSRSGSQKKDILGDSLSKEVQLIKDITKQYKEYRDMGASIEEAQHLTAQEFSKSLDIVNAKLAAFGIATKTSKELATMSLQEMRNYYQTLLSAATSANNAKGIEALEKALANVNKEIASINYKKLTDGLNNELNKIKEEYELAIQLDADPELSSIFMDALGLSEEELAELPRSAADAARLAQEAINRKLKENKDTESLMFNVDEMLNRSQFNKWLEENGRTMDDKLTQQLKKYVDYVNKVRLDETKKTIQEWDKLLDKYAEYETKRRRIMEEAERERETARRKNAPQDIFDAIDRRERAELAKADFEQFQQMPTWITATGDLSTLTDKALSLLIKRIQEYKKNAKYLEPKQIKEINRALKQLYKEQHKGNPFIALKEALIEAKERFDDYQVGIDEAGDEIDRLNAKEGQWTKEETARFVELIDRVDNFKEEQKDVAKTSEQLYVDVINSAIAIASKATGVFKEMADAIGGEKLTAVAETLSKAMSVLERAGAGAAAGAAFGGYGAVIGAVAGALTGAITMFADELSGNARINDKIKDSERAVRKLEVAYNDLQHTMERAYGTETIGLQRALVYNKELQLAELERQLTLEQSRKSKNRDEDKILDLQDKVNELRNEISDDIQAITNDLLGISGVGDAVENTITSMIDAFKNGEDYMKAFEESFDDMIDNMIVKALMGTIIGKRVDDFIKDAEEKVTNRATESAQAKNLQNQIEQARANLEAAQRDLDETEKKYLNVMSNATPNAYEARRKYNEQRNIVAQMQANLDRLQTEYEQYVAQNTAELTPQDIAEMRAKKDAMREGVKEEFLRWMDAFGIQQGEDAEQPELSALQQGIQGITETTANALEAYMNGVLQQVYLHSSLLTEIRDFLIPQDGDIQLSVQAQMLLQLQQSYQVQQSIQSILENWNNASGQAVRVELVA